MGMYACDVMDKSPLDQISEIYVWNDLNLAEAYVNDQYKTLPNILYNEFHRSSQMCCYTDEAVHKYGYWGLLYKLGNLTPSVLDNLDLWSYNYGYIKGCNVFLQKVDDIPVKNASETEKRDRMKGEILALRAWNYLNLAARYGGVVLVTEPFGLDDDFIRSRSSMDETVAMIVKDLDDAAELLPDSYDDANWGRMTKGIAMGLKSRILLYNASPLFNPSNDVAKWQSAARAAKDVIDYAERTGLFALHGDKDTYEEVFLSKKNSEMMLFNEYNQRMAQAWRFQTAEGLGGGIDGTGYAGGWSSAMISQAVVDAFEMLDGTPFDWNNPEHAADPYANRDPRLHVAVTHDNSVWIRDSLVQTWVCERENKFNETVFKDNIYPDFNPNFNYDQQIYGRNSIGNLPRGGDISLTGYYYRKFNYYNYNYAEQPYPFESRWIIMRYAEILLNYAEAVFETGNETEALLYLNMIRKRVGMPEVTGVTGDALRKKIWHEREVELCLEGHRYFDARRWLIAEVEFSKPLMGITIVKDKNSDFKVYTPFKYMDCYFPTRYYLQPIPLTEIQRSGIEQNPGY